MALGGTVEFLINNAFKLPMLAETYKAVAHNGLK